MGNLFSDLKGDPGSPGKDGKDGVGLPGSPGKDGKDGAADPEYFKKNSMWCANGEMCSIGSNGINFASTMTGQEAVAGHIAYRKYDTNALDIVGAGLPADGVNGTRKVKVWDHLDVAKKLTVAGTDLGATVIESKTKALEALTEAKKAYDAATKPDHINLTANVPGQDLNAGKIFYRKYDNTALEIVGAGVPDKPRRVKIYDILDVPQQILVGGKDIITLINEAKAAAGTKPGPKGDTGTVTANSGILVQGKNTLRLGDGVAGKEGNAGAIGYQTFSNALDIVGAGTVAEFGQRKVRIFDRLVLGEWELYQQDDRLRIRNVSTNISYDFARSPAGGIANGSNLWANWTRQ